MMRALFVLLIACPFTIAANAVQQAAEAFKEARADPTKYANAAALFAKAAKTEKLTPDQQAAWSYSRLRVIAVEWNNNRGDAAVAARVIAEATDAIKLVPENAELQKFGNDLIAAASAKPAETPAVATGWFVLESNNFRIRHPLAAKDLAESLSVKAEEQRAAIFNRWSGPAGSDWAAKCEIVIHATAADFAMATNQPAAATGHALVRIDSNTTAVRRIDLRADDDTAVIDAMPRELTHVILADLFPHTPPPRWAADGMSALAMSPAMVERYLKTANSLARKGELATASQLLQAKTAPPAEQVTSQAVGSVVLVEFLAKLKGERSLTIFLRDIQRYGLEKSVDRQFGFSSLTAMDTAMSKSVK